MNCNKLSPEKLIKLGKEDIERTKKGIKTNLKFLDIVNKKIEEYHLNNQNNTQDLAYYEKYKELLEDEISEQKLRISMNSEE